MSESADIHDTALQPSNFDVSCPRESEEQACGTPLSEPGFHLVTNTDPSFIFAENDQIDISEWNRPAGYLTEERIEELRSSVHDNMAEAIMMPSGIPFAIRHRFLRWLNPFLEDVYFDCAKSLGREIARRDLCEWYKTIQRGKLKLDEAYTTDYASESQCIFWGTEHVRHDFVHRRDISVSALWYALCLPALLGDSERSIQVNHVFELLCAACAPKAPRWIVREFETTVTLPSATFVTSHIQLFSELLRLIETGIFRYTKKHHPQVLEDKGWFMPEQVELPAWCCFYQRESQDESKHGPVAIQDSYADPYGDLLSSCIKMAKSLRNNAEHRDETRDQPIILDHVHNTIMCLYIFAEYEAAIEAEILCEQYVTGTTRSEVLQRLQEVYLNEEIATIYGPMARRRESRRREALASMLESESLWRNLPGPGTADDNSTEDDNDQAYTINWEVWARTMDDIPANDSAIPDMPYMIRVFESDDWAFRQLTFSDSMHPQLRILPIPNFVEPYRFYRDPHELQWAALVAEADTAYADTEPDEKPATSGDDSTCPSEEGTESNSLWGSTYHSDPTSMGVEGEDTSSEGRDLSEDEIAYGKAECDDAEVIDEGYSSDEDYEYAEQQCPFHGDCDHANIVHSLTIERLGEGRMDSILW